MNRRSHLALVLLAAAGSLLPASGVAAGLIGSGFNNGDFETGDFTGWALSAIDYGGDPIDPLFQVIEIDGNNLANLPTGTFADVAAKLQVSLEVD